MFQNVKGLLNWRKHDANDGCDLEIKKEKKNRQQSNLWKLKIKSETHSMMYWN